MNFLFCWIHSFDHSLLCFVWSVVQCALFEIDDGLAVMEGGGKGRAQGWILKSHTILEIGFLSPNTAPMNALF